jgi:hypothetical protein
MGYMKDLVYEFKVDTRYKLLQVFDAARSINDATGLHKVTLSMLTMAILNIY